MDEAVRALGPGEVTTRATEATPRRRRGRTALAVLGVVVASATLLACDTDGDGILDDTEKLYGTNHEDPEDPDPTDTDGDGLSDWREINGVPEYQTDPNDPDTDNDGLNDGDEVNGGSNPLDDTDPGIFG
jgi:hypothetical protein